MNTGRDDNTADNTGDGDDRTAELLSQALHEEAAMVHTDPSALHEIQERTGRPGSSRRSWLYAGVGAAAATAAIIAGVAILGDSSEPSGAGPATGGGLIHDTQAPASPDSTTANHKTPTGVVKGSVQPLTYVGISTHRLFTEEDSGVAAGDPQVAMDAVLTATPQDSDYTSGWPSGVRVEQVSEAGSSAGIDLTGPAQAQLAADPSLGPNGGMLAIQALLRSGGLQPGHVATFTYNGDPVQVILGVDVPVTVSSDDQTRAFVQIEGVTDGQTLDNPVTVTVSGNTFEATVNWQLLDDSGSKIDDGFVTTPGGMGVWSEAPIKLGHLDPGTYTIRCLEYSPKDGKPTNVDDKTFTVR